ncbi:hypothetical protein JCM10908_006832 [Rhodotorula pacifica]|uniref:uncharacterized protein n=1 Tax=Rhodotorula pacifica TaxID=1495444 RepID=UPI003180079C
MATAPTSSSSASRTRSASQTRTDKKALLDALAEELKRARAHAEERAREMIAMEEQVEAKHREFLDEEARLKAKRDANAATIASLRRELARAKQDLEDAAHVEEHEAEAYLDLLREQDRDLLDLARNDAVPRSVDNEHAGNGAEGSPAARMIAGYGFFAPASPEFQRDEFRPSHPTLSYPFDEHEARLNGTHHRPERPTSPLRRAQAEATATNAVAAPDDHIMQPAPMQQQLNGEPGAIAQAPLSRRWSRVLNGFNIARAAPRSA